MGSSPSDPVWSADGKTLFFNWNPEAKTSDSLYQVSSPWKKPVKAGKEAAREMAAAGGAWDSSQKKLVYAFGGDLYLRTGSEDLRLTKTAEGEFKPFFLAGGKAIGFQKGGNVYTLNLTTASIEQSTDIRPGNRPSGPVLQNEPADFQRKKDELALMKVLQSRHKKELERKTNLSPRTDSIPIWYTGSGQTLWISPSPNGHSLLWQTYFNQTGNKATMVPDYVNETTFTRSLNAREKVGSPQGTFQIWVGEAGKTCRSFDPGTLPGITKIPDFWADYAHLKDSTIKTRNIYCEAVAWSPNGELAILDIRSQDNKDRWLVEYRVKESVFKVADHQRDEAWIAGPGIDAPTLFWLDNQRFLFQSEATGFSQVYVRDSENQKTEPWTQGNFEVQECLLSRNRQWLWLKMNDAHPGAHNVYRMSTTGARQLEKWTTKTGGYKAYPSPDGQRLAFQFSTATQPWGLFLQESSKNQPQSLTGTTTTTAFRAYPWREPKLVRIPAGDGKKPWARLYQPEKGKGNGAAVLFVHGAGYLQNAHLYWSHYFREYMFHNLLADAGFTVLDLDYRGSSGYGRDWRTGIYRHMGGKDLSDYIDAARWMTDSLGLDGLRMGIYGGSYGGFLTLMALFQHPGSFKAGAALRSVTDWAHYNHGYTSNILNEPHTDTLAYRKSSPIWHAEGLQDQLLICHGMVDVNVHVQDVIRLSQRLIELGKKDWEMALYPIEDHAFIEPSSWTDEYRRILKLFERELSQK
jgi:dipeptidyl aminopeptidase/acylaminoacyl peptidase